MRETRAQYRIQDLAPTDRPREKLVKYGADKLLDEELIAIATGCPAEAEEA